MAYTDGLVAVQKRIIENGISSGSTLMSGDGSGVLFCNHEGVRDAETMDPVDGDTIFHMYSMTKVMTVVCALSLWEQGLLELDAPVGEYIPEYSDLSVSDNGNVRAAKKTMTVRHLFTMTSGLTYLYEYGEKTPDCLLKRLDTVGFAKALASLPLAFEPGERFNYSLSHDVLGAIIEIITGKTLDKVFKEKIFGPLGMADAYFYQSIPEEKTKRLAKNTAYADGKFVNIPLYSRPAPALGDLNGDLIFSGGSGLVCTARDYAAFLTEMANGGGRLLKPMTVKMMTSPQLDEKERKYYNIDFMDPATFGEEHTYALGVRVQDKISAERGGVIGEWGWSGALGTWFFVTPSGEWFLYLHQNSPAYFYKYIIDLRKAYYDRRG
ncbi:MAG: beta-lactamase family protein [Clostridia bacterium]|nr:beta-lactamase family protein [Clostridia bacterium]